MKRISERPMWRFMVKLVLSVFAGKGWRHAQDWLPGLYLIIPSTPEAVGEIRYRGDVLAALLHPEQLKVAVRGSIYIVGSGPSVQANDLGRIEMETAILLNGAISLVGEALSRPLAIAVEDERFIWRHFAMMRDKVPAEVLCLLSVSSIRAICEIDRDWLRGRRIILIDNIVKPAHGQRRTPAQIAGLEFAETNRDGTAGFSNDPARGVFQGGSVVISALQFAISCKPKEVGLFGIDISNADKPRFYEQAGHTAKSGLVEGQKRILDHIELAHQICERRGIRLTNFSSISALRERGLAYDDRFAREG